MSMKKASLSLSKNSPNSPASPVRRAIQPSTPSIASNISPQQTICTGASHGKTNMPDRRSTETALAGPNRPAGVQRRRQRYNSREKDSKPHKDSSQSGKPAAVASVTGVMAAAWPTLQRSRSGCSGGFVHGASMLIMIGANRRSFMPFMAAKENRFCASAAGILSLRRQCV